MPRCTHNSGAPRLNSRGTFIFGGSPHGETPHRPALRGWCAGKPLERILDANLNRAREGLRVTEEVTRFVIEDRGLSAEIKRIRHTLNDAAKLLPRPYQLLRARNSDKDIGKNIFAGELERESFADLFYANIQRVKESLRALEEFSKLRSAHCARGFKNIRYEIYDFEKKAAGKIAALRNSR